MKSRKDIDLLVSLAEFRLSTAEQLAAWHRTSEQMIRRRCRALAQSGLIATTSRGFGKPRGRPESVYSVSKRGVAALRNEKRLPTRISDDRVTGDALAQTLEHQLMLNWVAIKASELERTHDEFNVKWISSTSSFHLTRNGTTILADHVEFPNGERLGLIPDAAMCITHRARKKELLFFVEVDMGTESCADRRLSRMNDIRRKICVYRNYLIRRGYNRYECRPLFGAGFSGFRLLLITATSQRTETLKRLLEQNRPSEFAWTATYDDIRSCGLSGSIWVFSGDANRGARSIIANSGKPNAKQDGDLGLEEG